jgi:uncharacterized protein YehS (DUF1456 family)
MINNDVIRSVRYILDIRDSDLVNILKLADMQVPLLDIQDFLRNEEDPNYLECEDGVLAHFLDGLIFYKRGKDESRPPMPMEFPMTNNIVLKKLRVAFELREDDVLGILEEAGIRVGRAEISAFFRRKGHQNYRECGDQFLRNFLKGLTLRLRG